MNRAISVVLVVFLAGVATTQIQQRELLAGRYYNPARLNAALENADTEIGAQYYLVGAYDLTQDSGKSCAMRNTTTHVLLEKIFSDYLHAHPELMQSERTAAGVAAQAFAEYWPCKPKS